MIIRIARFNFLTRIRDKKCQSKAYNNVTLENINCKELTNNFFSALDIDICKRKEISMNYFILKLVE